MTQEAWLRLNEYLLIAALIFLIVAAVINIVILTAKRRGATAKQAAPVMALAGGGSGVDVVVEAGQATEAPAPPPAKGGLASYALGFSLAALLSLTVYLVIRTILTGHSPLSNQHEFAVSFTWAITLCYVIAEWRFKFRLISVVVIPITAALLVYSMTLDAGIAPLVPALQNNLMLPLHVGFAILSYGAGAVGFGAAVAYLVYPRLKRQVPGRREQFDELGYKATVISFPLLTMMILIGAIWAETAWGRFWGWDPKETSAFIAWLIYAGYLHSRVVMGWRGKRSAVLLIIGFAAAMFAFFSNHFLGGLHSYG
ncbi:MAG: c-type cytochrome biogenesis protein CcsB [Propionibacteriaceae bacterium]|jgi:cytochrome c-type biogenesis protein CcsB|nr:c-type cytochrome biogenesis protein CcsB [Propionibacteriaceae bacterium]